MLSYHIYRCRFYAKAPPKCHLNLFEMDPGSVMMDFIPFVYQPDLVSLLSEAFSCTVLWICVTYVLMTSLLAIIPATLILFVTCLQQTGNRQNQSVILALAAICDVIASGPLEGPRALFRFVWTGHFNKIIGKTTEQPI